METRLFGHWHPGLTAVYSAGSELMGTMAVPPGPDVDCREFRWGTREMADDLALDTAEHIVETAKRKAAELKTRMDIAVVDAGGNLKAFVRMDGAWLGSIDIAIRKARTARWFDMNTGEIGKLSQPGGPLYNIEHSNDGLITFPGGVPLRDRNGNIVGVIGVSGSTVENDHAVATAGSEALGK